MTASERVRDRIIAYLEACQSASPKDIVVNLGEDADRVVVQQTLGRMTRASLLKKVGYGRYILCPGYERRSVSVGRDTETFIVAFLTDQGGIAYTREIHRAVWGGERFRADRPYDYRRVQHALRTSERLCQSYGRGVWNLPEDQMSCQPLCGRWVGLVLGKHDIEDRDGFFRGVGSAFAEARGERGLGYVSGEPAIGELLEGLRSRCPSAERKALELQAQDREAGEDPMHLNGYLYYLFEQGLPALHLVAPASLYRECARLFEADATALSRGNAEP